MIDFITYMGLLDNRDITIRNIDILHERSYNIFPEH